jgi:hypothetical protein
VTGIHLAAVPKVLSMLALSRGAGLATEENSLATEGKPLATEERPLAIEENSLPIEAMLFRSEAFTLTWPRQSLTN